MITITLEQVREVTGSDYASVTDSTINMFITLSSKLDECLELSYPNDTATQEAIKLNAIAHMTAMSSGKMTKSQAAASGASRSFQFFASVEGIKLTNFGRIVQMLDTSQCFESAFPQGDQFQSGGFGRTCRCN